MITGSTLGNSARPSAARRWAERTVTEREGRPALPRAQAFRALRDGVREPRDQRSMTGAGPYEVRYDVSIGYAQDRLILLP
ncbi:MAG: hypothetical protein WEF86_15530 [Gemmatimonadota bacterium]